MKEDSDKIGVFSTQSTSDSQLLDEMLLPESPVQDTTDHGTTQLVSMVDDLDDTPEADNSDLDEDILNEPSVEQDEQHKPSTQHAKDIKHNDSPTLQISHEQPEGGSDETAKPGKKITLISQGAPSLDIMEKLKPVQPLQENSTKDMEEG